MLAKKLNKAQRNGATAKSRLYEANTLGGENNVTFDWSINLLAGRYTLLYCV